MFRRRWFPAHHRVRLVLNIWSFACKIYKMASFKVTQLFLWNYKKDKKIINNKTFYFINWIQSLQPQLLKQPILYVSILMSMQMGEEIRGQIGETRRGAMMFPLKHRMRLINCREKAIWLIDWSLTLLLPYICSYLMLEKVRYLDN